MEETHPRAMHAAVDANCLADLSSSVLGSCRFRAGGQGRYLPEKAEYTIVRSSLKLGESLGINAIPHMFVNRERLISGPRAL